MPPKQLDAKQAKRYYVAWPKIKPQRKTKEARKEYLGRKDVKRWIKRNAADLRVVDIRHFADMATMREYAEVYHVVGIGAKKRIRIRLVCGDPPPC